jgi:ABC-2 type transport system permease protein
MDRTAFVVGLRFQLRLSRHQPGELTPFLTVPLSSLVFIAVVLHAERPDLLANALVAPVLIGLWLLSISISASILDEERWQGTLELSMAAPVGLHSVLLGRICAVTCFGVVPIAGSWLLGWLVFGVDPLPHHPVLFTVTLVLTGCAIAGTSTLLMALFALSRAMLTMQNFLSYPVYVVSGVLVPVQYLPDWLQPLSWTSFLYWSAALLRDCLGSGEVRAAGPRLLAIAVLGIAGLVAGRVVMRVVSRRLRGLGTVTHA